MVTYGLAGPTGGKVMSTDISSGKGRGGRLSVGLSSQAGHVGGKLRRRFPCDVVRSLTILEGGACRLGFAVEAFLAVGIPEVSVRQLDVHGSAVVPVGPLLRSQAADVGLSC